MPHQRTRSIFSQTMPRARSSTIELTPVDDEIHYISFMDDASSASRKATRAVSGNVLQQMKDFMDANRKEEKVLVEGLVKRKRYGLIWTTKYGTLTSDGKFTLSDTSDAETADCVIDCSASCCEVRAKPGSEREGRFQIITREKDYEMKAFGGNTSGSSGHDNLVSPPTAAEWIEAWRGLSKGCGSSRARAATCPGALSATAEVETVEYVVQASDTLEGIAMAYGVTPAWLKRRNGRAAGFHQGQTILVPVSPVPSYFEPHELGLEKAGSLHSSPGEPSPPPSWSPNVVDYVPTVTSPAAPLAYSYEPTEIETKHGPRLGVSDRIERIETAVLPGNAHRVAAGQAA